MSLLRFSLDRGMDPLRSWLWWWFSGCFSSYHGLGPLPELCLLTLKLVQLLQLGRCSTWHQDTRPRAHRKGECRHLFSYLHKIGYYSCIGEVWKVPHSSHVAKAFPATLGKMYRRRSHQIEHPSIDFLGATSMIWIPTLADYADQTPGCRSVPGPSPRYSELNPLAFLGS